MAQMNEQKLNISNMTIEMSDTRKFFWQWDTGCTLRLVGAEEGTQAHFYRDGMEEPLIVPAYALGDDIVCNIPDEMLQIPKKFAAYTYTIDEVGRKTYVSKTFIVESRPKPASYIYTPTEKYHVDEVVEETVRKLFIGELSRAMIEVDVLPTEDIRSIIFYRTDDGIYWHDGEWHRLVDADELESSVKDEAARATEAEEKNATAIAEETQRATEVEAEISEALEAHKTAYDKKIAEIEAFNTEDAENLALHISEYNAKVESLDLADRANADAITEEEARAKKAEEANASAISAEVARSTEAEEALDKKITDEVARQDQDIADATATANAAKTTADTLNSTIQFALTHSTETRDLLNEEIETARKAEGDNKTAIAVEEARAKGEEQKNATAIANEKTRAETAEASITNALNAHEQAYNTRVADIEAFNIEDAQNLATHISNYNAAIRNLEVADQNLTNSLTQALAQLNALLKSDDTTLNELQEVVDYIKNNKTLIDAITINKVNVSDVVDNLLSLETAKPLSANQGRVLKDLIDTFKTTYENKMRELEASDKTNADAIVAEQSRADLAEKANANAIKAEETRADTAEKALGARIDEVQATAQNALGVATSTLDTASRAKALAEQTQNTLNQEIERATQTHEAFAKALSDEVTTAREAERLLDQNKQDNLAFDGEYDAETNKVALQSTTDNLTERVDDIVDGTTIVEKSYEAGTAESLGSPELTYELTSNGKYYICTGIVVGDNTENVVIPSKYKGKLVANIQANAFKGVTAIKSVVIPSSMQAMGAYVFQNSTSLESVSLPNSLSSIMSYMFDGCSSLKKIIIPSSVVSIYTSAFANCTSLEAIYIPKSVTRIVAGVFTNCPNLTIYTEHTSAPTNWASGYKDDATNVVWGAPPMDFWTDKRLSTNNYEIAFDSSMALFPFPSLEKNQTAILAYGEETVVLYCVKGSVDSTRTIDGTYFKGISGTGFVPFKNGQNIITPSISTLNVRII